VSAPMTWSAGQRYAAEFLGTFALVFSISAGALFTVGFAAVDPLARITLASLAIGFGAIAAIYMFGDISGGHLNPAVTLGLFVAGRFKARDVVPYIVAQVAGGIVAVATVAGVAYGSASLWGGVISPGVALASQGYSGNGSPYAVAIGSVFLLEVAITFLLVLTVAYATRSDGFAKNLAPMAIGLVILMVNLVAIPIDGCSANPARSFAPAILSAYFSGDQWAIQQNWMFWVAPIVGGLLAGVVARMMREPMATD
jgi:aquaporin Z